MVGIVKPEGITPLFEHSIRAIQGGRNYQEDAAVVWPGECPLGPPARELPPVRELPNEAGVLMAVLADGMGGHAAGALAAQTICTSFTTGFVEAEGPATRRLQRALFASNQKLADMVRDDSDLTGMGATAVGLSLGRWQGQWGAHWISVGDSPLYFYRAGDLVQLNEDHSMAPVLDKMAERGEISKADAKADGRRHFLRSAVSGGDIELVDHSVKQLSLERGDYLIAASDGIQTLEEEAIATCVKAKADAGPAAVTAGLIAEVEAAANPYQDNTTILALRVAPAA